MRFFLAVTSLAFLLGVTSQPVRAADGKWGDVSEVLKAKDFWDKVGLKDGRKWTDAEQKQLDELKSTSKDAVIRLRANKVLVDLAGNGKSDGDEAMVVGCFRHLEKELGSAPVKQLCTEVGFTHYGSGTGRKGLFLIEHVDSKPKGFNGGLNLTWSGENKAVTAIHSWGQVVAK